MLQTQTFLFSYSIFVKNVFFCESEVYTRIKEKNLKILSKKYQLREVIPSKTSGGHISRTIVTIKWNVLRKFLRTNGHLHKKRLKQFTLLLFKRIQDIFWREVDDKYQRYICICLLSRNLIYEKIHKMHQKRPCYAIKLTSNNSGLNTFQYYRCNGRGIHLQEHAFCIFRVNVFHKHLSILLKIIP